MKNLLKAGLLCLAVLTPARAELVQTRSFEYRTTINARTFAEEARVITNPLHYPQLKWVIPDGSFVEKGTVITEFDRESLLLLLENEEHNRAIEEADLQRTLTQLRNRDMELHDELESLEDRLVVYQTQLRRLQALPEPDDVAIARGRLKVARLAYEAAEEDMTNARDRYDREMISPGEYDDFEKAYEQTRAQLTYREGMLAIASRPAEPRLLRKSELLISNTQLEIKKLKNEISRNREISKIEISGAEAQVEIMETKISETKADIANAEVRAPVTGYVVYNPSFRQHRGLTGIRMWKEYAFMTMPLSDTVALKGQISETDRRFFKEGDPVTVTVAGRPDTPLQGTIKSISALARDREDKERQRYRPSRGDSGIMVYDVIIETTTRPDWLRIGLSASCELMASTPVTAPSIPATYIKTRNAHFYLSMDGIYQKVEGIMVDGYLLLSDTTLEGREIDLFGEFPERRKEEPKDQPQGYRVSGELMPADLTDVTVGDVYHFQKIAWLIPEDTVVTQGQVVAKLDATQTEELVLKTEARLQQAINTREKEEEEVKLREQENLVSLTEASNLWENAQLTLEDLLDKRDTSQTLAAEMNKSLAEIKLEFLDRELKRVERAKVSAYSPLEKARLKRDHQRATLELEAATIRLQKLRDGATPEKVCKAEMAVREREDSVINLGMKLVTDRLRKSYDLTRAQQAVRKLQDSLDERYLERDNLILKAPRDGLVRYGKVRSGGSWIKADVGSLISDRAVPVQIADVSHMYVRLELPERYYTQTQVGMEVPIKTRGLVDSELKGTVSEIDFLFRRKRSKDSQRGLYSSHENLGETVFFIRIEIDQQPGISLKPGTTADVMFPFIRPKTGGQG